MNFDQMEIRSHQGTRPNFEQKKNSSSNISPFAKQVCPQNLFGSRTYTSPGSFDSSSRYSYPIKNEINKGMPYNMPARKFTNNSNSIKTKLRSDNQSEKFIMLRNVVENIDDPQKRMMLLNFLDQSTIKTEYVTMKESSSSGEDVKGLKRIDKMSKRRHKSPLSVLPQTNLERKRRDTNVYSEERKRFSLAKPRLKSVAPPEQLQIRNYAIERKNGSDEFDSKNGDK